ncbi:MAG: hypothetical protein JJU12_07435 [Chlamydiales bacterium]|nr:hypothetical protein [Chlamydiales bacterium]
MGLLILLDDYTRFFRFSDKMGLLGSDPATSIVDLNGRAHGQGNLYLASIGLIRQPIGTNPNLPSTAQALKTV